ncbi:AAA family ATPase, partial [Peribacillus simplex]|uniref:AAA family ATPase n=1 Tax=Peribacillus simplex TaxID=1478 RepID=UPI00296EAE85
MEIIKIWKEEKKMRVSELRLSNFKSFGEELELVSFDELTAIIGANSTGKTSLITSLLR